VAAKVTKQPVARLVEPPAEVEPLSHNYLEEECPQLDSERKEWFWLLWRSRKFLARVTLLGLLFSTIIAFVIPKRYESTTRLMPPDQQSGSGLAMMAAMAGASTGGSGSALSSLAGDLLGMKSSGALFVDILSGRTVQDGIISRFDLRKVYHDKYWEDARKDLAKYTNVSEDRKSGVITIVVTDRDRYRARDMAQAYVEELDHLVAQVSTSSARRERIFIEQRLQSVKHDLDTASQQFSEYASKNTAIDITEQGKAMVEAAAKLQGELIASQSELEGLEQIYTADNVRVRSLRARVDELKQQLDKFSGFDSTEATDSSNSPAQFPTIRQLPLLGVRWADLYRQTKIQEKVYELLTQQYELAKIEEAKEIPVVKVLDVANVPERKSFPPCLSLVMLGTMLALAGAVVWIFGSESWKKTDPQDPRKLLLHEIFALMTSMLLTSATNSGVRSKAMKWVDYFRRRRD
jgi:capsule polysaccharide export protein KpsE/RkpR